MNNEQHLTECEDFELMISGLIDNELSQAERQELDRHLIDCSSCRVRFESFRRLDEVLENSAGIRPEYRAEVAAAVFDLKPAESDLRKSRRSLGSTSSGSWRTMGMWSLASVAAVLFLILIVFQQRGGQSADPSDVIDPLASLNLINYQTELNQQSMLKTCELDVRTLRAELEGFDLSDEQEKRFDDKIAFILDRIHELESEK